MLRNLLSIIGIGREDQEETTNGGTSWSPDRIRRACARAHCLAGAEPAPAIRRLRRHQSHETDDHADVPGFQRRVHQSRFRMPDVAELHLCELACPVWAARLAQYGSKV